MAQADHHPTITGSQIVDGFGDKLIESLLVDLNDLILLNWFNSYDAHTNRRSSFAGESGWPKKVRLCQGRDLR